MSRLQPIRKTRISVTEGSEKNGPAVKCPFDSHLGLVVLMRREQERIRLPDASCSVQQTAQYGLDYVKDNAHISLSLAVTQGTSTLLERRN